MPKTSESRLSAAKRALLAQRLRIARGDARTENRISSRPATIAPPLSFAQERFWFREQLEPENQAYRRPLLLTLVGPLEPAALAGALNAVIDRHEALRAAVVTVQGVPILDLTQTCRLEVPLVDLGHLHDSPHDSEIRRRALNLIQCSMPLDAAPLLSVTLFRQTAERHVLVITMHHVLCDGWSVGVFVRDLAALYEALVSESPSTLPLLSVQYSDFAYWQRRQLEGDRLENQIAYWKRQLENSPHAAALPFDHARSPERTYRGAGQSMLLSLDLTTRIRTTAQSHQATIFMVMLAAFKVLLHRYHGQTDIVVGSPTAGRTQTELEPLVGFFVNLVVLRSDLSGNPTFSSVLDRVRTMALDAYANQELPFERLLEQLRIKRQANASPLFNVMFELEPPALGAIDVCGLRIEELEFDDGTALFDMSIELLETSTGIRVKCLYNSDLFETATVKRLLDHYETLLSAACSRPEVPIASLPMVTAAERRQLTIGLNQTARPEFGNTCVHQLIEEQARRHPDHIAVRCETEALSYEALDRRANLLARHLQSLGIVPGTLTGICLDRSTELIVAVLAVLKSGGAYVPLDPAYPVGRLQYMLADSGAKVLVTRRTLLEDLSTLACEVVCLERDAALIGRGSDHPLESSAMPSDLAMLIYTSGSTGQPKGVMIEHHSLVNYCQAAGEHYELDRDDRVLQFSSISFDGSAEEIFAPLCRGATVVLRNERMIGEPREFLSTCEQWGISVLAMPTAYWHELVRGLQDDSVRWPAPVRLCAFGGEQAGAGSLRQWFDRVGRDVRLVNTYGPTETTISSTFCDLDKLSAQEFEPVVPIGVPLANTTIYLLDAERQPVPVGVIGELCVGGAGVARGYLNRSGLTEAAFVDDPFSDGDGGRLYRTGDLARRRANGILELVGRRDHQVKIRGFRIEPGEIEHALDLHPAVARSLILPLEAGEGDADAATLVAYVIPSGSDIDAMALRDHLKGLLPAYLLPTAFVTLAAFPLTPNGKVDRAELPAPPDAKAIAEDGDVGPNTPIEELLAEIWMDLLQLPRVSVHQDFFELGGDSIKATQLIARLMDRAGVRVSLRKIFEAPSIAELALLVEECMLPTQT